MRAYLMALSFFLALFHKQYLVKIKNLETARYAFLSNLLIYRHLLQYQNPSHSHTLSLYPSLEVTYHLSHSCENLRNLIFIIEQRLIIHQGIQKVKLKK